MEDPRNGHRSRSIDIASVATLEEVDRQIAEGIAAEERGELHDGEQVMAEIRTELEARRGGW